MKDKVPQSNKDILRQKAEEILKNKPQIVDILSLEGETLKLIHELDVHQIELEMQNEELKLVKEQMEIAAEKYIDLYDFAPSGYFTLSKNGEIQELNFKGANMLGKERSLLINNKFAFFITDDKKSTFSAFFDSVLESKKSETCEIILSITADTPTHLLLNGIAIENGEKCFISAVDITKLKKAEKELQEKEEKYRLLFDSNRDSITIFRYNPDGKTGNFIEANTATVELFGYSKQELMTMSIRDVESVSNKIRKKRVESLLSDGKIDFETFIKTKKGKIRYVETKSLIINYLNETAIMCITRDITESRQIELNAQKAQDNLLTILEAIPDILFEVSSDGTINYYQTHHLDLMAVSPEVFMGKRFQDVLPAEASRVCTEAIAEASEKGWSSGKQYSLDLAQGKHWFELSVSMIKQSDIKNRHFIVLALDITARKQSMIELNKMNRVYSLISQINNLILRSKVKEELFNEICRIAVEFGKFRMSWIGMLDETDAEKKVITAAYYGHEEGYFEKGIGISILNITKGSGPTGRAMRDKKSFICNDIANDPIMKPWRKVALERGYRSLIAIPIVVFNKIIGSFNLYSEETNSFSYKEEVELLEKITQNIAFTLESILFEEERIKTQEKIKQLSQAVEQSQVNIIITNTKGEIEYVNPKFSETTGYSFDEVIGKNPSILKPAHAPVELYQELWQTLLSGKEWHGEFHNVRKDGAFYWESASISPILNTQGKTTHYIAIKEDITARKKVEKELIKAKEKAEESDRLKSTFLANMSHEIRTPMNGILGFTELLKSPNLAGEKQQEYISIIEKSGVRMLNIINDIISISKIESGQVEIFSSETNINEQIEYLETFFKPEAVQKGIQITATGKLLSKEAIINTDKEKVYAILTNLVKNAVKFTDSGSIEFGCINKSKYLEFFVKDSGTGISKSQQKIIFERFRQANETMTRTHEGSGLGLAISKAYVEMLGGKIWVDSEPGEGSAFYFTIPTNNKLKPIDKVTIDKVSSNNKAESQIKLLKILIVEDDAISKLLITIAVKPYSKEILKVSTGTEAIEVCLNNPDIDLVMMDINMPKMDGYEATKKIREFNKDLVIIAQTANGMQSDRDNAIAAGCTDYISKPINISSLNGLLHKYFKK